MPPIRIFDPTVKQTIRAVRVTIIGWLESTQFRYWVWGSNSVGLHHVENGLKTETAIFGELDGD
jgi:hypothetical protein